MPNYSNLDVEARAKQAVTYFKSGYNCAQAVVLVKPQFEAGREKVGKKGVVRDPQVHEQVICEVAESARETGFRVKGLTFSPIRGPEGNIEYLLWLEKAGHSEETEELSVDDTAAASVVRQAAEMLNC